MKKFSACFSTISLLWGLFTFVVVESSPPYRHAPRYEMVNQHMDPRFQQPQYHPGFCHFPTAAAAAAAQQARQEQATMECLDGRRIPVYKVRQYIDGLIVYGFPDRDGITPVLYAIQHSTPWSSQVLNPSGHQINQQQVFHQHPYHPPPPVHVPPPIHNNVLPSVHAPVHPPVTPRNHHSHVYRPNHRYSSSSTISSSETSNSRYTPSSEGQTVSHNEESPEFIITFDSNDEQEQEVTGKSDSDSVGVPEFDNAADFHESNFDREAEEAEEARVEYENMKAKEKVIPDFADAFDFTTSNFDRESEESSNYYTVPEFTNEYIADVLERSSARSSRLKKQLKTAEEHIRDVEAELMKKEKEEAKRQVQIAPVEQVVENVPVNLQKTKETEEPSAPAKLTRKQKERLRKKEQEELMKLKRLEAARIRREAEMRREQQIQAKRQQERELAASKFEEEQLDKLKQEELEKEELEKARIEKERKEALIKEEQEKRRLEMLEIKKREEEQRKAALEQEIEMKKAERELRKLRKADKQRFDQFEKYLENVMASGQSSYTVNGDSNLFVINGDGINEQLSLVNPNENLDLNQFLEKVAAVHSENSRKFYEEDARRAQQLVQTYQTQLEWIPEAYDIIIKYFVQPQMIKQPLPEHSQRQMIEYCGQIDRMMNDINLNADAAVLQKQIVVGVLYLDTLTHVYLSDIDMYEFTLKQLIQEVEGMQKKMLKKPQSKLKKIQLPNGKVLYVDKQTMQNFIKYRVEPSEKLMSHLYYYALVQGMVKHLAARFIQGYGQQYMISDILEKFLVTEDCFKRMEEFSKLLNSISKHIDRKGITLEEYHGIFND